MKANYICILMVVVFFMLGCHNNSFSSEETTNTPTSPAQQQPPAADTPEPGSGNPTPEVKQPTPEPITGSENHIHADHLAVDACAAIPEVYISAIKKMLLNIPGESHGRGYHYGLQNLAAEDGRFAVQVVWAKEPPPPGTTLRSFRTIWRGGSSWLELNGEEDIWTSQQAIDYVNNHLAYCRDSLKRPVDVFGWGWCWDMTATNPPTTQKDKLFGNGWAGRSVTLKGKDQGAWGLDKNDNSITGNEINMDTYLTTFAAFAATNPGTVVFLSTGPVDKETRNSETSFQRYLKNEHIRKFAEQENMPLLDYADILCHDPRGNPTTMSWQGHLYPAVYPLYVAEYNGGQGSCHISKEATIRIGKAIWWMLARIAGWDGKSEILTGGTG